MSLQLSRFQPLNRSHSPVDISSDSQVVVESPSHYEAPAVPVNISVLVESIVQLSQISALSSVQLSPNWVHEDYSYDTMDVFPVFQVSPEIDRYLPATSPVTPPVTDFSCHIGLLCHRERLGRSTVSSGVQLCPGPLSNRQQTCCDYRLIPLPDDLLLLPLPVPLRPQSSPERQSLVEPCSPEIIPFDAYCVLSDTGGHPLI